MMTAHNNRFGIMLAAEYVLKIRSYIHLLNQGQSIAAMNSTTLPNVCDRLIFPVNFRGFEYPSKLTTSSTDNDTYVNGFRGPINPVRKSPLF